jgi:hypothetical protein
MSMAMVSVFILVIPGGQADVAQARLDRPAWFMIFEIGVSFSLRALGSMVTASCLSPPFDAAQNQPNLFWEW